MKCLRCGYCCMNYAVIIVDDPAKGLIDDNLKSIGHNGPERCPHLKGDKPGEYSCAIHDFFWYKETPCFDYTQIEANINDLCRMGEYIIKMRETDE